MTTFNNVTSLASSGVDILHLAERRMNWLQRRESFLAGNVANTNTPDYKPKDISPFQGVLETQSSVSMLMTDPRHISHGSENMASHRTGTLSSINGNQVSLEDELTKIADTNDQHRFATTVYGRYMSMYNLALGSSGTSL